MAWYYSKDPGDHALETLCILLSLYLTYLYGKHGNKIYLIFTAVCIGMAFITRTASMLIVPPIFLMLLCKNLKKTEVGTAHGSPAKDIAIILIILLPFMGLFFWYNYYRFGSIFETGYTLIASRLGIDYFADGSFLTGLTGFLFSPGRGYFYYSPISLLFFFSIRQFSKKNPVAAACFVSIIISYLLFYSKYIYWHGCGGWGPRFVYPITPFLVIPIAALLDEVTVKRGKLLIWFAGALFVASFFIQIAAVSVNPAKYYMDLQINRKVRFSVSKGEGVQPIINPPVEIYFEWDKSPILAQFKFADEIRKNIRNYGQSDLAQNAPDVEKIKIQPWMNLFDIWWVYGYFLNGNYSSLVTAFCLLLIAAYSGTKLANIEYDKYEKNPGCHHERQRGIF